MVRQMRAFSKGSVVQARYRAVLGLILAAPLTGCLGYDGVINHGAVIDAHRVSEVKTGMDAQQVLNTLGTPSTTSTVGGDAWYYVSQRIERSLAFMPQEVTDQRVMAVYFDKNKKVQRIANYGMEDGKPVNFLSRTTPVPAAEYHMLQSMMSKFGM
jgi:outer membrane protein assembly factor BamE (lipoprotein component of BamABCDE complex)